MRAPFAAPFAPIAALALLAALAGCGGAGSPSAPAGQGAQAPLFSIGGSLSGLPPGSSVSVSENGGAPQALSSNGPFALAPIPANGSYRVSVAQQPAGASCSVSGGSGAGVQADISSVAVVCSAESFSLAGSISGLPGGASATLLVNGADPATLSSNGPFALGARIPYQGSYSVTVASASAGLTCSVSRGSGFGMAADASDIAVACSELSYSVSGAISGLEPGRQATLYDNGGDPVVLSANGGFSFPARIAYGGSYLATVNQQPLGETCTVSNGSGAGMDANVSGLSVSCSPRSFSVSGSISGLAAGQQATLADNGADPLSLSSNGPFSFPVPIAYGGSYLVTVATQPAGQTCSAVNASGSGMSANASGVRIVCSANSYPISGSISGLAAGQQATLTDNGGDPLVLSSNGPFSFPARVAYGGSWSVAVATQPSSEACSVSNGSGAGISAPASSVAVSCAGGSYTVGGSASGLAPGATLTLLDNGGDPLSISANGPFAFPTPIAQNGSYLATVSAQPAGQTCSVANGFGSGIAANVSNLSVACSADAYTLSGSASGLAPGQQVTLLVNGASPTAVSANGPFALSASIPYQGSYAVSVASSPAGKTCTVSNGSGSGMVANVSDLSVACSASSFSISGTVSGLAAGQQVTLLNNSADPIAVSSNGPFAFDVPVAYGGSYFVVVNQNPTGQTCSVANGPGSGVTANVSNVAVSCSAITYSVGGSVSGLSAGQQVTLRVNGYDPITQASNGPFSFAVRVAYNAGYLVTVATQPTAETCTVVGGVGYGLSEAVISANVVCSPTSYQVSGTISGLAPGQQATLTNNGSNPISLSANGPFSFPTPIAAGSGYLVAVATQPAGAACTVVGGSGSGASANPSGISALCSSTSYAVSGSVSGLLYGQQVTLTDNGADPISISANGPFSFPAPIAAGAGYQVAIANPPTAEGCSVSRGSGSNMSAPASGVSVACSSGTAAPPCALNANTSSSLAISTSSCPGGIQNAPYAGCSIAASGGTPPYSFCVGNSGSNAPLPEGMSMSPSGLVGSALVGGQGLYGVKVVVSDSAGNTAAKVVNFPVAGSNAFLAGIFPPDSIFHHRVDAASTGLPADASPAAPIPSAFLSSTLEHFFGNAYGYPFPYGTPALMVPWTQPAVPVETLLYGSAFGSAPLPSYAPVEDTLYNLNGDRHVIVYQAAGGGNPDALYEMYQGTYVNANGSGSWSNSSSALWSSAASSYALSGVGGTNAAGLPDGPLLITADEVIGSGTPSAPAGAILHTIRMTLPTMLDNFVWPATATAGVGSCSGVPVRSLLSQSSPPSSCSSSAPAGEIYRIKAGAPMPACLASSPQSAIVAAALRDYGMIVGDNGYAGQLLGTPDSRWSDSDLNCLRSIPLSAFEPVNVSGLMISPSSAKTSR